MMLWCSGVTMQNNEEHDKTILGASGILKVSTDIFGDDDEE